MNSRIFYYIIIVLISAAISCGAPGEINTTLSGNIEIPGTLSGSAAGPLFIAVSKSDNIESIMNDPVNSILYVSAIDRSKMTFSFSLSDAGLQPGDTVFLFAFADNDYSGGIPYPTPGDVVGFYVNQETLSTGFRLSEDSNNVLININRLQYDISPEIIGIIDGDEAGDIILIAYAGDFNSLDFTDLDTNAIIGYKKFYKSSAPCLYSIKVMPYIQPEKYSMPILGVYIIALLDKNGNGMPDSGDSIGFPINGTDGDYPMAINIANSVNSTTTIYFKKNITDPVTPENPMILTGTLDAPTGYDPGKPMFLIVAKSSDPNEIFTNMLDTVKYFQNITASYNSTSGTFSFNEDLSSSGLVAGDTVMIMALWDKDFTGGFPSATSGDTVGFIQNKNAYAFTVQLNSGTNTVVKESDGSYTFNTVAGYDFSLKRTIYEHAASIKFKLEQGNLSATEFANGNLVQVIAVYDSTPYTLATYSTFKNNLNMDNIIGSAKVLIEHDLSATVTSRYTIPIMPAIPSGIPGINPLDFSIPDIYIVGFLDTNGNGKPDTGEKLAFYYKNSIATFFQDVPDKITLVDGANVLSLKNVKFSQTY
ncbi:MAG: hypothetical protein CVV49_07300 [Spirochaetae bacterium HGW-Spirochaetae-5]|nr:MAG: hypothetical protein CVV49_07300 [Spirochaetae bacterium HGW-Spirochaetae-5]